MVDKGDTVAPPQQVVADAVSNSRPLSIYAHFPYCPYHCEYCTFLTKTNKMKTEEDFKAIEKAGDQLLNEAKVFKKAHNITNPVDSIYFGGGTPIMLKPEGIRKLVKGYIDLYKPKKDAVITMEATPDTLTRKKINAAIEAGVNRFSMGVQTFDEKVLKDTGRKHSNAQALAAIKLLGEITRWQERTDHPIETNIDLIRGLKGQTLKSFEHDIDTAIAAGVTSIYVYRLRTSTESKVKSVVGIRDDKAAKQHTGTRPFALSVIQSQEDPAGYPSFEDITAMQVLADNKLRAAGYIRQHTSQWSKPSKRPQMDKENWGKQIPTIAHGWGAYSYGPDGLMFNTDDWKEWNHRADHHQLTAQTGKAYAYSEPEKQMRGTVQMLKTLELDTADFENRFHTRIEDTAAWPKIQRMIDNKLMAYENGKITFTEKGFPVADEIIVGIAKPRFTEVGTQAILEEGVVKQASRTNADLIIARENNRLSLNILRG